MKRLFIFILTIFTGYSVVLAEGSLFGYDEIWQNQNNKPKKLQDFSETPFLISMVYTSCEHTCPVTISKIQQIKTLLGNNGIENLHVVLASFDDVRDTPDNLKKYMKKRRLSEKEWTFLSPKSQKVARELSVVLGINYKKLGEGNFSHSNVIALVDAKGEVIAKIDNLSKDIEVFKGALLAK
ncbi:MAG: SCO family protein [Bdellovibrionales bacterium]|nr:SCO family protein [Bdellovibrionales bacterium]